MNAPDISAATSAALFAPAVPAVLALADGTVFRGRAIGAAGVAVGEVVFNTAMTGYQEIMTDPSYAGQIVTLTYPHIGNTGVNAEDVESGRIHVAGLVIRDLPALASSWRKEDDLSSYLRKSNVVGIADLDTRRLTRVLRTKGAQNGCIVAAAGLDGRAEADAVARARAVPSMAGLDLAKVVSCTKPYEWNSSTWALGAGYRPMGEPRFRVVAYDYGIKHNIMRMHAERGCRITVVPAQTPAKDVLAMRPDGVFLSNGPGDPEPCDYANAAIREIVAAGMPTFGICLGHQLLGLAAGGRTLKMKFGHHGANHPVLDKDTGQVLITSQNHGFAVDAATLPSDVRVTHVSLFDGSLQGIALANRPAFGFQGHPEASPGPHDLRYLFDRFAAMMQRR
jgi:carbamoyl-phosphate synthase small subunit